MGAFSYSCELGRDKLQTPATQEQADAVWNSGITTHLKREKGRSCELGRDGLGCELSGSCDGAGPATGTSRCRMPTSRHGKRNCQQPWAREGEEL
jgi:hypothetical protein